ncbi:predicted protein [Nematostella vectensis]|uniref:non-specific serine/threonine protein kinase n=1 Tax=Nematostella vectensis TaxID=45351 RepID=A7RQY7_NEMVE|nr:predicted protein [Nematostella vectensis]|eukprot:XP_001638248.1 predicted protein [Nematostella vectensis]
MQNYEKVRIVGRGAYGTVYLCRRLVDNFLVIIKQIPVEEMTKEERQSALNEVKVLSMFQHPNIIRYYDSFVQEKALMIVMEYAQGGTIYDYLQQRGGKLMDEDEILRLFVQILLALRHVHKGQILHRDLKTQNILLNKKRKVVKIGDFGISKILSSKSKANTVIGSPCYISPELCEGKPYNQKSDVWSLGCVLYELTTLKRAFEASNLPALVLKIMRGYFSPIPERYSEELRKLILDMLVLDPTKRPGIKEIMAQPVIVNALFDLPTDVGRVPCTRFPRTGAGIAGMYEESSASTILEGLPENLGVFAMKPQEPQHMVYHWGGGITYPNPLPLPQHDSGVVQVSCGRTLMTGVTANGRMILWEGSKSSGLMSSGGKNEKTVWVPRFLEGQSGITITKVSCGDLFTACLTDRGILMTFGSGTYGCLGHGTTNYVSQAKIVEDLLGFEVEDISCGSSHIMAVTADHEVFAWGRGDNGRLGTGSQQEYWSPKAISLPEGMRARSVHCGVDCSFAITLENKLLACGSNRCNKLALDNEDGPVEEVAVLRQVSVPDFNSVGTSSVAMGTSHTLVLLQNGKLYSFGSNSFGQLGYVREGVSRFPQLVESLNDVSYVACGDTFSVAVSSDSEVFVWGKGARGRLGNKADEDVREPVCLSLPAAVQVLSVSCSNSGTLLCGKKL